MATMVFLVGLIAVNAQASPIAKGNQPGAAAVGRFVVAAMLVASSSVVIAIFVAAGRAVGTLALEQAVRRRKVAQRVVEESDRHQKQEEKPRALPGALKRERDGTVLGPRS